MKKILTYLFRLNLKTILNKLFFYYFIFSLFFLFFLFGTFNAISDNVLHKKIINYYYFVEDFFKDFQSSNIENLKITNDFEDYILLTQDYDPEIYLISSNGLKHKWNTSKLNANVRPYGAYLYNNGDIIFISDKAGDYSSISKISKNSEIIWTKNYNPHHWFSILDEKVYFSDRKFISQEELKEKYKFNFLNCKKDSINYEPIRIEDIIIINASYGNVLNEISILDIFSRNPSYKKYALDCIDPFHINDVIVIDKIMTKKFDKNYNINVGDILVSIRNMNLLIIFDPISLKIKWSLCCNFFMQHSPRITNNNSIIVFDNLGGNYYSRLMEFDINSKELLGFYIGRVEINKIKRLFFSESRGYIDIFKNNYLITSSDQKVIFNLDCKRGNISPNCVTKTLIESDTGIPSAQYVEKNNLNF